MYELLIDLGEPERDPVPGVLLRSPNDGREAASRRRVDRPVSDGTRFVSS
jgi:hypothetical protein